MVVRSSHQPGFDHSSFVSGVVVHNDMDIETIGNMSVDLLQEVEELRSMMALVAFADHKSRSGWTLLDLQLILRSSEDEIERRTPKRGTIYDTFEDSNQRTLNTEHCVGLKIGITRNENMRH